MSEVEQTQVREQDNSITFDDFMRVDLRVGQILSAEKVEKSEKLVRLEVNLGPELGTRQIVAGIATFYPAESLVGRKIVVVANLKPRKLMGLESNGMILAAHDGVGGLDLLSPGDLAPAGTRVS